MSYVTTYLCIGCPLGCRLEVEEDDDGSIAEVRGNTCRRGKDYAEQEHIAPKRMVTTTVQVLGGRWARLPVRTTDAIPKEQVQELCNELQKIKLQAPLKMGDIILGNALETGIDVVASRNMPIS